LVVAFNALVEVLVVVATGKRGAETSGRFGARTANKSVEAAPRSALWNMYTDFHRSVVFRALLTSALFA
jgi:hypothetical protein